MGYDKHYACEGIKSYMHSPQVTNLISVRLSNEELDILRKLYPNNNLSFAIRSCIHECAARAKM